jgi:hypothetical protein
MKLFTASFQLVGNPVGSTEWAKRYEEALSQSSMEARRPKRRDRERVNEEVPGEMDLRMPVLRKALTESTGFNFIDPEVNLYSDGTLYSVPALRVPIHAVNGWMIGDPKVIKKAGGGFFFGGMVPIGE